MDSWGFLPAAMASPATPIRPASLVKRALYVKRIASRAAWASTDAGFPRTGMRFLPGRSRPANSPFWLADYQRNVNVFFVRERALAVKAMRARHLAMICREDNDGPVGQPERVEL